jgi:hypothetical protein
LDVSSRRRQIIEAMLNIAGKCRVGGGGKVQKPNGMVPIGKISIGKLWWCREAQPIQFGL